MFIENTINIEGVSKKEKELFTWLENINESSDDSLLPAVFYDLCSNKIADAVLYKRLSQRILFLSGLEGYSSRIDSEEILEEISDILDQHADEELDIFKITFGLAMELGYACSMDFTKLPDAISSRFETIDQMIDFVQNRELKSISKFYSLYTIAKNTSALIELDEEFIGLIEEIIEQELEHFNELKDFSNIGLDEDTQKFLENVSSDIQKGF